MRTGEMIKSNLLCQLPHSGSWRDSQTFSANRVQQASYPMSNSHKSRGEFGIKAIRYVNYRVAVGGEMTIGFSPNRVQRASHPMPNSYISRGEFGIREIRYVNYRVAVGPLVGQGWE